MPTTLLPFFLFYKILLYNILRLWEQGHIWVYSIKKKCLNSRSGVVVVKAAVLLKRLTWRGRETLSLEDSPDAIVGVEECLTNKACLVAWLSCAHSSILPGWMLEEMDVISRRMQECVVSTLLSSLCFCFERRKWQGRSSNASVSLSPETVRGPVGVRTRRHAEITRGWFAFCSRAGHVMPLCQTELSHPPTWNLSKRTQTLRFHIHLRGKDEPASDVL